MSLLCYEAGQHMPTHLFVVQPGFASVLTFLFLQKLRIWHQPSQMWMALLTQYQWYLCFEYFKKFWGEYVDLWASPMVPSLVAQMVKCLLAMRETRVQSMGWEDPLEKEMATHLSTLAWKIPWIEEPGRLHSVGSQRVEHDWVTSLSLFFPMVQW